MMEYVFIAALIILSAALLAWAIVDIVRHKRSKVLILLLLLAPIAGPLIYFQASRGPGNINKGRFK